MRPVDVANLSLQPFRILDREWALLVAGRDTPNPMTVSWGGMGTLWNRPVVTVYVRPTRYTWGLLNDHPEFTLNFFAAEHRSALELCGCRSGRDLDKWAAAGIQPEPSSRIAVPRVAGARLVFECRVLATLTVDPARFLDPEIGDLYPVKDYHRVYLGEALAVWEQEGV